MQEPEMIDPAFSGFYDINFVAQVHALVETAENDPSSHSGLFWKVEYVCVCVFFFLRLQSMDSV